MGLELREFMALNRADTHMVGTLAEESSLLTVELRQGDRAKGNIELELGPRREPAL